MAKARPFEKTALVMGILLSDVNRKDEIVSLLESEFGRVCSVSPTMDFPYTDYYDHEMSGHPSRFVLMFEKLVDPSTLATIKTRTNELEKQFLGVNGRTVNIDPGLLSLSNFILATCKDRSHRVALQDGVYAEVTLIYQDRDFQKLPWSYADYSSDEIRAILREYRTSYKKILTDSVKG